MPKKINIQFLATIILYLTIFNACNVKQNLPICTKDGTKYCTTKGAFRNKWYDYYELGLSCMKGECFDAAIDSFQKAIHKRYHDKRMTRPYGMHIMDYFPHRELGICYYLTNDFDNALKELKRSIQQETSAKAKFYLDEVRKELFYIQKIELTAPEISVHGLDDNIEIWTHSDPVNISGIAKDDRFIHKISISDRLVFMDSARKIQTFEESFSLPPGQHIIQIIAKNLMGGITKRRFSVLVDRSGPIISLNTVVPFVKVEGFIYDTSGEITLTANHSEITLTKGKQVPFHVEWNPKKDRIMLVAKDKANNQTVAVIDSKMKYLQKKSSQVYFANNDDQNHSDTKMLAINTLKMNIHEWSTFNLVYTDRITFSGSIHSQKAIDSLHINEIPIAIINGVNLFFSQSLPLKKGMNTITMKAIDQLGRKISKKFQFQRKIQEVLKHKNRFKMKIYPFEQFDQEKIDDTFYSLLIDGLLGQNRFQIFLSDDFKGYGTFDCETNRQGKVSDAAFLKGMIDISSMGIDIVGRVFGANSKIIDYVDIYEAVDQNISLKSQLKHMAERLSEKFHLTFPLVSGRIIQTTQNQLIIQPDTWYHGKGTLRMDWPVIIYNLEDHHSNYPSETQIIGKSTIKELMEMNFGVHRSKSKAKIGDGVITY